MSLHGVSDSFRSRADSAAFWEAWVGAVLARSGLYTVHHPFLIDGEDHGHTWDLDVSEESPHEVFSRDYARLEFGNLSGPPLKNVSVEIKSLSQVFTVPADYPFEHLLICSQNSFLRKWPGTDLTKRDFLFVSTTTGSVLWLPAGTRCHFGTEVLDRSRNELYKVVTTGKGELRPLQDFVEYVKA